MVKRIGGFRRKTRNKFSKPKKEKGKLNLTKYFQEFINGDTVALIADPAIQGGMYHPRFHAHIGMVNGKQGRCYKVLLKDHKKLKEFIVHPVHLKKITYETNKKNP